METTKETVRATEGRRTAKFSRANPEKFLLIKERRVLRFAEYSPKGVSSRYEGVKHPIMPIIPNQNPLQQKAFNLFELNEIGRAVFLLTLLTGLFFAYINRDAGIVHAFLSFMAGVPLGYVLWSAVIALMIIIFFRHKV